MMRRDERMTISKIESMTPRRVCVAKDRMPEKQGATRVARRRESRWTEGLLPHRTKREFRQAGPDERHGQANYECK